MSRSLDYQLTKSPPPPARRRLPLVLAAIAVGVVLVTVPVLSRSPAQGADPIPTAAVTPIPTVAPTPTPIPAFDFTQPAPKTQPVDMDYFSDALFIGDSRTDGLQIYSGIKGATFYCYKGLNIFDMSKRQVVEMNGGKYTVVEALEKGPQYKKIYISLGVNELGYPGTDSFYKAFKSFLEEVKAAQPDAIIYLQNLVPVNPEICAQKKQPSYVNNDRVADFNEVFPKLAEECQVALVDVKTALSDENGILPAEATVDGVHFTKAWYQKWLEYLMCHTVTPEAYQAGQTAAQ